MTFDINRRPTIFMDIDGCILKHKGNMTKLLKEKGSVLPGVIEKFNEWHMKGCLIIITTGRPESSRKFTEQQLEELGLFYDQLVMGLGNGPRHIFNDIKPDGTKTAFSYNLERNKGLEEINLDT